jgi:hypothetical protein
MNKIDFIKLSIFIPMITLIFLMPTINASPEKILIEPAKVNEGEEAEVKIILDSAPNGLAGYDITVIFRNIGVEPIFNVKFPDWAKLSDSSVKGNSIRLRAVDLNDVIKPGSNNIDLATIILSNTKRGETIIELIVNKMDDDKGYLITPEVEYGKLIVTGTYIQNETTIQIFLFVTILIASVALFIILRHIKSRNKMSRMKKK